MWDASNGARKSSFVIHIGYSLIVKLEWWCWLYWTFSLINSIVTAVAMHFKLTQSKFDLFLAITIILWLIVWIYPCFVSHLLRTNYSNSIRNFMIFVIILSGINFFADWLFIFYQCQEVWNDYMNTNGNLNKLQSTIHILQYITIFTSFMNSLIMTRMIYLDFAILFLWKKETIINESVPAISGGSPHGDDEEKMNMLDINDK